MTKRIPESLPEIILLDWDGTLVDSYEFLKGAHNHARMVFGYEPWDDASFKEIMLRSTREVFASVYGDQAEEAKKELISYVEKNHDKSMSLMDGAEELLKTIREARIKTGIVSNKRHERLEKDVSILGWNKYVDTVVGAGKAEKDKPAPEPVLMALKEAGINPVPEKIWYAGDMITDIETARSVGACCVFLRHGIGDDKIIETHSPDIVFDDLFDFVNGIKNGF